MTKRTYVFLTVTLFLASCSKPLTIPQPRGFIASYDLIHSGDARDWCFNTNIKFAQQGNDSTTVYSAFHDTTYCSFEVTIFTDHIDTTAANDLSYNLGKSCFKSTGIEWQQWTVYTETQTLEFPIIYY